jgi:hypothetical protein
MARRRDLFVPKTNDLSEGVKVVTVEVPVPPKVEKLECSPVRKLWWRAKDSLVAIVLSVVATVVVSLFLYANQKYGLTIQEVGRYLLEGTVKPVLAFFGVSL